ncbi:MAG: UDPglucose--hexose-phosphate uridylyltransferase [Clostridiales bacterium]|nr:UDPglucose--hexose-phosphate uridylyltransferase [Clostridiales bacterium]
MSQFRRDVVTGEWMIIAQERVGRPYQFGEQDDKSLCPFCPGNEHMTPNEIMRIENDGEWELRVVPNKYPAVCAQDGLMYENTLFYSTCEATGIHEVVIETRFHSEALHHLNTDKIFDVLSVYKKRFIELSQLNDIKYVQIFKNHGKNGGASLRHSHSQIVALPFVPQRIEQEMEGALKYYQNEGRCIFCDIIKKELDCRERMICRNDHFVAVASFAPRFSYEMWMIPLEHQEMFCFASDQILMSLADIFKNTMQMMIKTLGEFPYNLVLHTAPYKFTGNYYHWHIELVPRVSHHAGFEIATGTCITTISPEEVTQLLTKK